MEFMAGAPSDCSFRALNSAIRFSSFPSLKIQKTTLFCPSISSLRFSAPFPSLNISCKPRMINACSFMDEMIMDDFESWKLMTMSPLDGRYWEELKHLNRHIGELGLIYYRVIVEVKWLLKLSQIAEICEVPNFSEEAQAYLQELIEGFSMADAKEVKNIEGVTNHDVKAVEYFLKKKCQSHPEIAKVLEFFHFGCTSEDINNLAHGLMLKSSLDKVIYPVMDELIEVICTMAEDNASTPMHSLSRTYGQVALPTTLGKELAVFAARLSEQRHDISQVKIKGKFAGAVGNYNAHIAAYPNINWPLVAKEFVESFGLCFNPCVTQIEPHDYMAKLFYEIVLFNSILIDFDRDVRGYVSLSYFKQTTKSGEIGSSTMPRKVNPINFGNIEGNLLKANATFSLLSGKLPMSRWQRDLTDSTLLRNMGDGLGHSLLAYKTALKGLRKLKVDKSRMDEDLNQSWEMIAEAVQSVVRLYGVPEPYEKLKELTRERAVTKECVKDFIKGLELPKEVKKYLSELTPHTYIGVSSELAESVAEALNSTNGVRAVSELGHGEMTNHG